MYTIANLVKKYGNKTVLNDVSLEIKQGQFLALMGKNGSGKSTFMRILAQDELFEKGSVIWNQQNLLSPFANINDYLVHVNENHYLPFTDSASKWVSYFKKKYSDYDDRTLERLCAEFEIDLNVTYGSLSRGQKMKTYFAIQAAKKPQVYILDEITSVLDSGSRLALMRFLKSEQARGCVVVISTNIASETHGFITDVCFIDSGKVILNCPVEMLTNYFGKVRIPQDSPTELHQGLQKLQGKAIGLNSDNTWSYLVPKLSVSEISQMKAMVDRRQITVQDVSIYYTGNGDLGDA